MKTIKFSNVGELRNFVKYELKNIDDSTPVMSQVIDREGGAWNLWGKIGFTPDNEKIHPMFDPTKPYSPFPWDQDTLFPFKHGNETYVLNYNPIEVIKTSLIMMGCVIESKTDLEIVRRILFSQIIVSPSLKISFTPSILDVVIVK